jgi:hypothetical protein
MCLLLAAAPDAAVFVPGDRFTLAWVHSIEKTRWEEDYAVHADAAAPAGAVLHAVQARIRGSGAGMDPPPGSVLRDGWYAYTPTEAQPALLRLSRSGFVPDYELCPGGSDCRPLGAWLPSDGGVTLLRACARRGFRP